MKRYHQITSLRRAVEDYRGGDRRALDTELNLLTEALLPYKDDVGAELTAPHLVAPLKQLVDIAVEHRDHNLIGRLLAMAPPCLDTPALAVDAAECGWTKGFAVLKPSAVDERDGFILGMSLIGAYRMGDAKLYHMAESDVGLEDQEFADFVEEAKGLGATVHQIRSFMRHRPGERQGLIWPTL